MGAEMSWGKEVKGLGTRIFCLSLAVGLGVLLTISMASCIRGKDRPEGSDLGDHDAGDSQVLRDGEAERHGDQGESDALRADHGAPPPTDFPCGADYWTKATKTNIACASRYVLAIESGLSVNRQVAVAVDRSGSVGLAYGHEMSSDEGQLHLVSFPVGARQVPKPTIVAGGQFDRIGVRVAMVPRSSGGFHLLYVDVGPQGSELNYSGWAGSGQPNPESLSNEVGLKGSVDLVEGSDKRVYAIYYADIARGVYARVRPKGGVGSWTLPQALDGDIVSTVPGLGQISVVRHAGGGPAYALHFGALGSSTPRFRRYDAINGWSAKKTLDNNTYAGIAGQSIDLVITPSTHYATYFAIPTGSTNADLRLASWASSSDTPTISVLEQAIPVKAGEMTYEAALAVDPWGLLHLALILPSGSASPSVPRGVLEYRRQVLVGGQKKWITDIVDDDVLSASTASPVALWVEPRGRPHIAYFNGRTGKMMYATRDDR